MDEYSLEHFPVMFFSAFLSRVGTTVPAEQRGGLLTADRFPFLRVLGT